MVTHKKAYSKDNPSATFHVDDQIVVDLFPYKIKDRDRFYHRNHPQNLHPESLTFKNYWLDFIKQCIEGRWIEDLNGTWVYMMPKLFYYINYVIILDDERVRRQPDLCDLEWIFFTYFLCLDGFSGFADDDKYTCHRFVERHEKSQDEKYTPNERESFVLNEIEARNIPDECYSKETGQLKKFIDPWVYLTRTYLIDEPRGPLGDPLYHNQRSNGFILGARGIRKDLEENTPIFTDRGILPIKNVKVGDKVYDHNGELTNVVDKASFTNQMQYEITFDDGRKVTCGDGHLWEIYGSGWKGGKVMPLCEIRKNYLGYEGKGGKRIKGKRDSKFFIRMSKEVNFPEKELPIEPYFLGLWLGDGTSNRVSITTEDIEIKDYIYLIAESYKLKVNEYTKEKTHAIDYHISSGQNGGKGNYLLDNFKNLNLINNKHIPEIYKTSSIDQRYEILKGLMDSDGFCRKNGHVGITQKNEKLINDLRDILNSLGIKNKKVSKILKYFNGKRLKEPKEYFTLNILTGKDIFKLKRKKERLIKDVSKTPSSLRQRNFVAIRDIKQVGIKPSHCLMVDNKDRLFLCGDYIVTHNSFTVYMGDFLHEWTFSGVRKMENLNQVNKPLLFAMGSGSKDQMNRTVKNVSGFYDMQPGKFEFEMDEDLPDYMGPLYKNYQGKLEVGKEFQHIIKGKNNIVELFGSTVQISVISRDRMKIVAGDRFRRVYIEEVGFIEYIEEVFAANIDSLKLGNKHVGSWIATGTGGDMESIVGSKKMFEHPDSFDIFPIPYYWKASHKKIGLFIPAQYQKRDYDDGNGFIYLELATKEILKEREKWFSELDSVNAGFRLMYNPIIPDEMLIPNELSVLPKKEAQYRLGEIDAKDLFKRVANIGTLRNDKSYPHGVRFDKDLKKKLNPILEYQVDFSKMDRSGAFVMYEPPPPGKIPKNMYWVIYDPAAQSGEGTSLHSVIVYKHFLCKDGRTWRDTIVAEWLGRLMTLEENYEQVIKIARFFNARIFPEINVAGFVDWCRTNKYTHILQRDSYELEKEINPGSKRSYYKAGFRMNARLKWWALQRYSDWLLEPREEDPESGVVTKRGIDYLYSPRILNEIIYYNTDDNFDHTSSMLGLMILIGQLDKYLPPDDEVPDDDDEWKTPYVQQSRTLVRRRSMLENFVTR